MLSDVHEMILMSIQYVTKDHLGCIKFFLFDRSRMLGFCSTGFGVMRFVLGMILCLKNQG